jgi:Prokaryotic E2 family E/Multiubiquitin
MRNEEGERGSSPEERAIIEGVEEIETLLEEIIDLEMHAKEGKRAPRARGYRFKVNDVPYTWPAPFITGREVLTLAGLTPPDKYSLRVKVLGHKPHKVELDEPVDLRAPGVEKFRAIRCDQHEGEYQGRRDAPVLDQDRAFLDSYGLPWEIIHDGSAWVILHEYPLPTGYTAERCSVAIRIEQGYPYTALDMMYVFPALQRADGRPIPQTQCSQPIDDKSYQRWSRHRQPDDPWKPGQDSLETHVYMIEDWFARELAR